MRLFRRFLTDMKNRNDIRKNVATILTNLRKEKGLSKQAMADLLYLDVHTWSRYEKAESMPDIDEFIYIFHALQRDALRSALNIVYPSVYEGLNVQSSTEELRNALAHYLQNAASDRTIRELAFIMFGEHGSNLEPQMQEFTMLDHLPLTARVSIARMIETAYDLCKARGELEHTEHIMPDIDIFKDGLEKGADAARKGLNSYTTIV